MQRLIAIDCDAKEIAFVTATAAGERITLDAAGILPLKSSETDTPISTDDIGKQLQTLIAKNKRSGSKVLIGVDRNAMELFSITVPPASDAELPELVLNQMSADSPNIVDESVIDFIANPGEPAESRRITAASLTRKEVDRVKAICAAAGLAPNHLLARTYETAALFLNRLPNGTGDSLLVNVIADEVDLIVVDRTRPLFFRTVRLPGVLGDEAAEQRLLDEIRRTLLVVPQNPEVGQVIESVYVFGTNPNQQRIVQQLSNENTVKAHTFDPFAGFTLSNEWTEQSSGRFFPLLGMLIVEAHGAKHAIDFANPRRAPIPPNRLRQIVMVSIAIIAFGGSLAYYLWETFSSADAEILKLKNELAKLKTQVKKSSEKKHVTEAIEDWNASGIVWLDELRDLASKFPSGQDLVIQRLAMTPTRGGRASISFQGLARESKVVMRVESALRDARHEVHIPRVEERTQDKLYSWSFDTSISLSPAKKDLEDLFGKDETKPDDSDDEKETSRSETKDAEKPRSNSKKKSAVKDPPAKQESSESQPYDDEPRHEESKSKEPREP